MAWTIDYTETAKGQLRKLDKPVARRIVDFMDKRIASLETPRSIRKVLTGLRISGHRRRCFTLIVDGQGGARVI